MKYSEITDPNVKLVIDLETKMLKTMEDSPFNDDWVNDEYWDCYIISRSHYRAAYSTFLQYTLEIDYGDDGGPIVIFAIFDDDEVSTVIHHFDGSSFEFARTNGSNKIELYNLSTEKFEVMEK